MIFKKITLSLILTATVFTGACAQISPGAKAPDFSMKDLNGKSVTLSQMKGKVVFINFFATWCGPCRMEFPEISKLHEDYAKNPSVKIISLSVDDSRTIDKVKPFVQQYKAKQTVLLGPGSREAAEKYKVDGIPMNVLIGKDGKVKNTWVGYRGAEDVKKWKSAINANL